MFFDWWVLCVYVVDDIIVAGKSDVCDVFYASSMQELQTTQGYLSWYLGCVYERDKPDGDLRMSQRAFIEPGTRRYGVDAVSGITVSQSKNLGPRRIGASP